MRQGAIYSCEVCGIPQKDPYWFVVNPDLQLNTLRILRWEIEVAAKPSSCHLCCAAHVEQFVYHWMVTGSLSYQGTFQISEDVFEPATYLHSPLKTLETALRGPQYEIGEVTAEGDMFDA